MKQHQNDSLQLSSMNLKQGNEISVYKGTLTTPVVIENIARIKKSFPNLPIGFYEIFAERIKANNFCDDRLRDSVNHVIENCIYPTPTIAQFISFDKTIKLLNYNEMVKLSDTTGSSIWNSYKAVKMTGRTQLVWVHVDEIKKIQHLIEEIK
jgi:hypothetical protein